MTQADDGEDAFVQRFLAPLSRGFAGAHGLRDDCATIAIEPGLELVVKTDPIAEGVHFFAHDPPADIAWKALAVNVSDLAAKGAEPLAYLMALSFPAPPTAAWMSAFASGLASAQAAFGLHLIGGDSDRRPGPVTISISAFGTVPVGRMVRRSTAKPGDALFVSGQLGSSALGLALLQAPELGGQIGLSATDMARLAERYRRPRPRLAIAPLVRSYASAAMDLSDGLAKDCGRMCRASGCGADIDASGIELDPAVALAVEHDAARWRDVLAAGDDYEVLLAVSGERIAEFEAAVGAAGLDFAVRRIGRMREAAGVSIRDRAGVEMHFDRAGYDHFRTSPR